jgi:hypothetical protein
VRATAVCSVVVASVAVVAAGGGGGGGGGEVEDRSVSILLAACGACVSACVLQALLRHKQRGITATQFRERFFNQQHPECFIVVC